MWFKPFPLNKGMRQFVYKNPKSTVQPTFDKSFYLNVNYA